MQRLPERACRNYFPPSRSTANGQQLVDLLTVEESFFPHNTHQSGHYGIDALELEVSVFIGSPCRQHKAAA
jgi:hypothetical protein